MKNFVLIFVPMLASCVSTQPDFVVMKYTWRYCWEACGKKDNLAAVSMNECICSQGDPIPINPLVRNNQKTASGGFMDDFLKFLNGE